MSAIERCGGCCVAAYAPRSNGNGLVYLECDRCGHVEHVPRRPDPNPTIPKQYVCADGSTRTRYGVTDKTFKKRKRMGAS